MTFFRAAWCAMRAAWSALPGDALGLLAMRACKVPAPSRVVDVGGVRVLLVEDPRTARLLDNQRASIYAQTLGRFVFCREPMSEYILAHELEHVRQWQRYGPLYQPLYWGSTLAYLASGKHRRGDNWLEAAARARADAEQAADHYEAVARPGPDRRGA
jgi:hypothetical protein